MAIILDKKALEALQAVVGRRLKAARRAASMTETEAALAIGHKGVTQLSLWEAGERMPPQLSLVALAKLYAVPLDYLCGLTDDPLADPVENNQGFMVRCLAETITQQLESFRQGAAQHMSIAIMGQRQDRRDLQHVNDATRAVKASLTRVKTLNPGFEEDVRGSANLEKALDQLEEIVARFEKRVESERLAKACIDQELTLKSLAEAEARVEQYLLPLHEACAAANA